MSVRSAAVRQSAAEMGAGPQVRGAVMSALKISISIVDEWADNAWIVTGRVAEICGEAREPISACSNRVSEWSPGVSGLLVTLICVNRADTQARNVTRPTVTDSGGAFVLTDIPPGDYRVCVASPDVVASKTIRVGRG